MRVTFNKSQLLCYLCYLVLYPRLSASILPQASSRYIALKELDTSINKLGDTLLQAQL